MKLPRSLKILLLALTLWPAIYMLGFMVMMMTGGPPGEAGFETLIRVHMGTMLVNVALLVFYLVHVFKASTVERDKRTSWVLTLLLAGPIGMPIYFFMHVWPEKQNESWANDHVIR